MARTWKRGNIAEAPTGTGLGSNNEIYHNNSQLDATDQPFNVVCVAQYYMAFSEVATSGDLFAFRIFTLHESITPTVSLPSDETDNELRGYYPFVGGPVYFNSRAKITVPPQHKLYFQTQKLVHSTTTATKYAYNVLLVDTPAA